MGGISPTEVDFYVFRSQPRFVLSYGPGIAADDRLLELKTQWTAQAETVHHFAIDTCHWSEEDIRLVGCFIDGRSVNLPGHRHDDLFPAVESMGFRSGTPQKLVENSGADGGSPCFATLYQPSVLQSYSPILRRDCLNLRTGAPEDRERIQSIVEWVRVCALTQRWLGILTVG